MSNLCSLPPPQYKQPSGGLGLRLYSGLMAVLHGLRYTPRPVVQKALEAAGMRLLRAERLDVTVEQTAKALDPRSRLKNASDPDLGGGSRRRGALRGGAAAEREEQREALNAAAEVMTADSIVLLLAVAVRDESTSVGLLSILISDKLEFHFTNLQLR